MYYDLALKKWLQDQMPRATNMVHQPAFYRRLEQNLDISRKDNSLMTVKPRWGDEVMDLTTSDFLSLNRTGQIRKAFLDELARQGDFRLSASGSRVQYGNYEYLLETEQELADFHGAETAWIAHSAFLINVGVLEAIPLPGDALVFDELSHASTIQGMKLSVAALKIPFKHNDIDALREVLESLKDSKAGFAEAEHSILICVESIYSMEGDICPLKDFVRVSKELFPKGNLQFIVDEAHSSGVLGSKGAGLVQMLGLEKDIAIRVHTCSKALASTGGIALCNQTIRSAIIHQSRTLTYSGAPSLPMVACIRAGYKLLMSGSTAKAQTDVQHNVKLFFELFNADLNCEEAVDEGLLNIPLAEDWEQRPFHSHIVAVKTRPRHEQFLTFHLALANMNAYSISYPVVPKGESRVRLVFHAHNTSAEIEFLVTTISKWAREMLDIEHGMVDKQLPSAACQVYALQPTLLA